MRSMRPRLHLKPGQKGTKQLVAQHGDRLICVRYRYDSQRKKRLKTVELVGAEIEWEPPRPPYADNQIVGVRIGFAEVAARERVKQAGREVEPRPKGVGAMLSPGGRARAGRPHREGQWHPTVDTDRRRPSIHA